MAGWSQLGFCGTPGPGRPLGPCVCVRACDCARVHVCSSWASTPAPGLERGHGQPAAPGPGCRVQREGGAAPAPHPLLRSFSLWRRSQGLCGSPPPGWHGWGAGPLLWGASRGFPRGFYSEGRDSCGAVALRMARCAKLGVPGTRLVLPNLLQAKATVTPPVQRGGRGGTAWGNRGTEGPGSHAELGPLPRQAATPAGPVTLSGPGPCPLRRGPAHGRPLAHPALAARDP